jgi:G3E family GTPase
MTQPKLPTARQPIPVTIVTGFLGAGKTTLLNRILNGNHGLRVAVLVNDFGSINIDAELVVSVESDVISLANGCVCCSIRSDLLDAVTRVLDRSERPEYVLLEASGVADPAGIAVTFSDAGIRDRIQLDSITCVVDADQVLAYQDQPSLMQLKMLQIACADMMILNKVDLAGPAQIAKVHVWMDEHYGRLRVVEAIRCDVPLEILLSVGSFDPAVAFNELGADGHICNHAGCDDQSRGHEHRDDHDPGHDHGAMFSTWSFETDRPISLEVLQEIVSRKLPASIYRCKGIIHTAEAPGIRTILQVVGRRMDVSLAGPWNDEVPRTRIVAIGAPGALDAGLDTLFERCVVSAEAAACNCT